MKTLKTLILAALVLIVGAGSAMAYVSTTMADANTRYGKPNNNYGTDSNLLMEPYGSDGYYYRWAWFKFDASDIKSYFDTLYGIGGWTISEATFNIYTFYRSVYSNGQGYASAYYSATDSWTETDITWNSQPTDGVFMDTEYMPVPANDGSYVLNTWTVDCSADLLNDILSGDYVSICLRPTDTDGASANICSYTWTPNVYGAFLDVVATAVPEPGSLFALGCGLVSMVGYSLKRTKR